MWGSKYDEKTSKISELARSSPIGLGFTDKIRIRWFLCNWVESAELGNES